MIIGDKQYKVMKYLIDGKRVTDISRIVGVSRVTIYAWMKDKEFAKELNELKLEIQTSTKEYLNNKIRLYVDEIEELAMNPKTSTKVRGDLLKYMVNRVWGNTTVKTEVELKDGEDKENFDLDSFVKSMSKSNDE